MCDACRAAQPPRLQRVKTPAQKARNNELQKLRYLADPDYYKEYQRTRRDGLRAEWVRRLGGVCAVAGCGETVNLQFDHKDWRSKAFEVSKRFDHPDIEQEMAKCQLLCVMHHHAKTAGDKRSMYGAGQTYFGKPSG